MNTLFRPLSAAGLCAALLGCAPPEKDADHAQHAAHSAQTAPAEASAHDRHAHPAQDERELIPLNAEEKAFMLTEMRMFVANTHGILEALNQGDHGRAGELAHQLGLRAHTVEMASEHGPMAGIRKKVPIGFMLAGRATHVAFDDLADLVRDAGNDRTQLYQGLAKALSGCDSCHQAYRVH